MDNSFFKEYRCECKKLLFRGLLGSAVIEIKCRRCGKLNLFNENLSQKNISPFELKINEDGLAKDGLK